MTLRIEIADQKAVKFPHRGGCIVDVGRAGAAVAKGDRRHLACGTKEWLSRRAAAFVSDGVRWWLVNSTSATAIQFCSLDGAVKTHLTSGGSCALPAGMGRLWLASPAAGDTIEIGVHITDSPLPGCVADVAAATPPPRSTTSLLPRSHRVEVLNILAAATWHRRRRSGFRRLTQEEVAVYLGLTVRVVKGRINSYRSELEASRDRGIFLSERREQSYADVCGLAIDFGLIDPDIDTALLQSRGCSPPIR